MENKDYIKKYLKIFIKNQLNISNLLKENEYLNKDMKKQIESDLLEMEVILLDFKNKFNKKELKKEIENLSIKEITNLNHPIRMIIWNWVPFISKYFSNNLKQYKCDFKRNIGLNLAIILLEFYNLLNYDYKIKRKKTYFYLSVINWFLWNQRKKEYWANKIKFDNLKREDFLMLSIKYFLLKNLNKLKNDKNLKEIEDNILKDEILIWRKKYEFKDWEMEVIYLRNLFIDFLEKKIDKKELIEKMDNSKKVFIEWGESYFLHLICYLIVFITKKEV